MKPTTPIIAQRNVKPSSDDTADYDILLAHKQKLVVPSGKKEGVIVFSRVSHKQLTLDKTGETESAAKLAVSVMRERLKTDYKIPAAKIDDIMDKMYAKVDGGFATNENALDAMALDMLINSGKISTSKVRYSEKEEKIAEKSQPTRPLPTSVELPELPDADDNFKEKKFTKTDGSPHSRKKIMAKDVQAKSEKINSGKVNIDQKNNVAPKNLSQGSPVRSSIDLPELPDFDDD